MSKGFAPYGGVLITVRVKPKWRAEIRDAARQLGCTAADIYREAIEAWLRQWSLQDAANGRE